MTSYSSVMCLDLPAWSRGLSMQTLQSFIHRRSLCEYFKMQICMSEEKKKKDYITSLSFIIFCIFMFSVFMQICPTTRVHLIIIIIFSTKDTDRVKLQAGVEGARNGKHKAGDTQIPRRNFTKSSPLWNLGERSDFAEWNSSFHMGAVARQASMQNFSNGYIKWMSRISALCTLNSPTLAPHPGACMNVFQRTDTKASVLPPTWITSGSECSGKAQRDPLQQSKPEKHHPTL